MKWFQVAAICLAVGATALTASPAIAQEDVEAMSFEELLGEAKSAYDAEDFDRAITMLLAANRKQPNARLLLNVGKSHEKAGDCVSAQVYFRAFVRNPEAESSLVEATKKSIADADQCEGWDELMAGRLILKSQPAGATVMVDGEEVGTTPTEVVGLMEGQHTVAIQLEGYETAEETVDLAPDRDETVDATLTEQVEEPEPQPDPEPAPEPEPVAEDDGPPIVQYAIAGGVGAVGLGLFTVGLITDLSIPSKYDEPRQEPGISQAEFDRLTDQRKAAATRATIFYIAGGVLVAGGAGYGAYVAATSSKEETAPQLTFTPAVGPDGFGVMLHGEF